MNKKSSIGLVCLITLLILVGMQVFKSWNSDGYKAVGQTIDSFNGVKVYNNGSIRNISGRNISNDGYNLGLKYQCVEFVKRYYYEHLNHKMPNSYGHAKDYFNRGLRDGQRNSSRNLTQYSNPSKTKPKVDDLIIFSPTIYNKFGHVAIVSKVTDRQVEIIQQNAGGIKNSRATFDLGRKSQKWQIQNSQLVGWLRKQ